MKGERRPAAAIQNLEAVQRVQRVQRVRREYRKAAYPVEIAVVSTWSVVYS